MRGLMGRFRLKKRVWLGLENKDDKLKLKRVFKRKKGNEGKGLFFEDY